MDYNEKDYVVNAAGIPYVEESVNYPKSMIVDTYTDSHEFTVVFLQIYVSVDTSNVDSKVFTEITASAGKYQWYSTPEGNFDYVVARLALYQVVTNTYSFYIALLGSTTETQGENIGFKFGMYAKENEILPVATFRTEYNKSTNKIRYVADFGIKFKANISIGLTGSSQSFRRIERKANIAQNNDAWSLASFCIGYIPYIGDAVSLIQALYDTSYTTPTDSEWMRSDYIYYCI